MKGLRNIIATNLKIKNFMTSQWRCVCDLKSTETPVVKKYVYISQSTDIYTNLALEDWFYTNTDFTSQELLMLWKNKPCVVIGRHQNPWLECNVDKLGDITPEGVKLARRNSGGGTVYHDEGNLNITFFTTNQHYNRKHNLQIVTRALFREYKLKVDISERLDLVIHDSKVSGTASKLSRKNAYHHCTLLVSANKDNLHQALSRGKDAIKTRATRSTRSPILNLKEENPKVSIDNILKAVGHEFLHSPPSHSSKEKVRGKTVILENGFQLVNPTEVWFPGITQIRENLESCDWIFGKCPEFSTVREVRILDSKDQYTIFHVNVLVEQGKIKSVNLTQENVILDNLAPVEDKISNQFRNQQYSESVIDDICNSTRKMISDIYTAYTDQAMYT